jgi:adenine/guanine/hypoxanthine permease
MTATLVTAIFGSTMMGVFANRPFAVTPYMDENALVAVTTVPAAAYAPALIVVGSMMVAPLAKIDFADPAELPAFAIIALMSFSYNVGVGITAELVLCPFLKLISGRAREVRAGLWTLALLSLLFFIFYPYH